MIRKFTLLLLACMGSLSLSFAQPQCGFDKVHKERMQTNPEYAAAVNQFSAGVAAWVTQQQSNPQALVTTFNGNKAWEIPVVVHVVHTGQSLGTPQNPSVTTIQNFINYLSQAFTASYSGHLVEANGGTRIPIVFKLAARTPNCTATNGIERIDLSGNASYAADGVGSPGLADAALKAAVPAWPGSEYYNIWIVTEIDGKDGTSGVFTAGYAYFPQATTFAQDGTIVLANSVGVGNSVITHELGHAFNLLHVFEGGSTTICPTNSNCLTDGDEVCDTEPIKQSPFNCPADPNPCTGNSYFNTQRNFMDYSNCKDRFTPGQRQRVYSALQDLYALGGFPGGQPTSRSSLISSLGATPLGSTAIAASCNPTGTGSANGQGPRAVTIYKDLPVGVDTIIMNAISGSVSQDNNLNYFDRTCQHRAELVGGQTYTFRVRVGNTNENVRAWIDYNNDGTFSGATETVYAPPFPGTGVRPSSTFTVPLTAVSCTPLRMRVVTMASPGVPGPCSNLGNGQAEDYEVIIRGAGGGGGITPGLVDVTIDPTVGNPSCDSTTMIIKAKPVGSTLPVWFQWFKKTPGAPPTVTAGPSGATDSIWTSTGATGLYPDWTFRDKDTVWVRMAFPGVCGVDTTIDSIVLLRPDYVMPSLSIKIAGGTNPTCIDEVVTLGINAVSNSGGATWQWYRNGVAIPGATSQTYNVVNQGNGDVYYLRMIFPPSAQVNCNNFTQFVNSSNTITINHTTKAPTASIALTTGTNPGCVGQVLTFTASGTVLGTSPTYQWLVNGSPAGTNSATFSSTFNNGDVVSVTITNLSPCAVPGTVTSAGVTIIHQQKTADITIAQVSGGNPACSGHPVVFSATPVNSGPPSPQFQWLINNAPVIGANSPVFNTTALVNGDVVKCVLISTDPCVINTLDTSNAIQMNVTPSKLPKISFTLTKGDNPGCLDSLVEFTATTTDAGTSPDIEWLVNGFPLSLNNPVYSTTNLLNNDVVIARVVPTDGQCYLPDTGYSAPVTMVRSPTPNPPIISLINNMLMTDISGSFVWFGPGGRLTGGEDGKYHPGELGQYYAVTNNNGCFSKPSNILTITLLDINNLNAQPASIYPNPTTGKVIVDWGRSVNTTVSIYSTVGQKLMEEKAMNVSSKVLDLGTLAGGIYFVVITDENGGSSTTRITLTR